MRSLRSVLCLLALPAAIGAQTIDRTISSITGGALGGLAGLSATIPAGCGKFFADRKCRIPVVVKGFAAGNLLGSAFGAAYSAKGSSCGAGERFGRALAGAVVGAGAGTALVSRAHGYLRIGLSPLVQLAEGYGAASMVGGCAATAAIEPEAGNQPQCDRAHATLARDAATAGLAGGYAGLYLYFKHAWWSGQSAPHWFVQNDWDQNERDEDKFGHFFGGYQLTRITSELLEAGCMRPTQAALWAAFYAFAFQFQIEEWDGTQKIYGFSPADLIADAGGAALAVAQQRTKWLQATKPVWSYRPTLAFRRRNEPGHGAEPRATTDYSGQTYWFSTDVNALLPEPAKKYWPALIRVSPGYSITDYVNPQTGIPLRARRKILLSLDLDLGHLPGNNPAWNVIKHELSFIRVPGPTLQLTPSARFLPAYY